MGILGWIVLGLIAGAIAKAVMPGKDPGGIIVTMLLGIVGAIIGGFIGRAIFGSDIGSFFDLSTWLLAILGSVVVLAVYHFATSRGHRAHG
ncbi:putative membrane protein YeaQ/YmgE (transglycosylase-associated protein family) [Saccharothrix carnea]|uniref:Putative membrane protein YeaQ/YmgE (Transglycosylase-associated protein family) n=1 Tax=Saccharothrix carnea TaxID=1280637 RepID=A0A2P8I1J2_SACCR|nr:GlsB/YeaQ/YmgE family stress response membrane protein [Saccharothrix carnea]PSL52328.1 putative membrane protein YeaQ/YmgE (transglycosylase-associated protein family) [Saccharothrix carnea]